MFTLKIAATPVVASKFFAATDREAVLAAIHGCSSSRVVFIDTPATSELVSTVEALKADGIEIHVRDHHDCPTPANPREQQIADAANRVRELAGGNAIISNRQANPACSSLLVGAEFADHCRYCGEFDHPVEWSEWDGKPHDFHPRWQSVIVMDPDPDGLLGAMKALGITYPELDADAAVLDGPRSEQTAERLSPLALLLTRAMASLPPFDASRPQVSDDAKAKLFTDFVAVVQGNSDAKARLEKGVEVYEAGVKEAERLALLVTDILPGVAHIDVTSSPRFDLGTLAAKMEARPGCKVTVQRRAQGPIAAKHGGVQITLAVAKASQAEVNLQELLTPGFTSSPESGIISNTSFLLHVSQEVWDSTVLPALTAKFGG